MVHNSLLVIAIVAGSSVPVWFEINSLYGELSEARRLTSDQLLKMEHQLDQLSRRIETVGVKVSASTVQQISVPNDNDSQHNSAHGVEEAEEVSGPTAAFHKRSMEQVAALVSSTGERGERAIEKRFMDEPLPLAESTAEEVALYNAFSESAGQPATLDLIECKWSLCRMVFTEQPSEARKGSGNFESDLNSTLPLLIASQLNRDVTIHHQNAGNGRTILYLELE